MKTQTAQTADVASLLVTNGVRPSAQRVRILQFLMQSKSHPTADDVYCALRGDIPSLSKTTVYNTLTLLVEKHLAHQISTCEGEAHFDGDVSLHGHFQCVVCGGVTDFPVSAGAIPPIGLDGCRIDSRDVLFRGVCAKCRLSR